MLLNTNFSNFSKIQDSASPDDALKFKSLILICLLIINAFLCILVEIFLYKAFSSTLFLLTIPGAAGYLLTLVFFRITHNFATTAQIFCLITFALILSGIVLSGGYPDGMPFLNLLIVIPVYAISLLGRTSGVLWWVICVTIYAVIYFGVGKELISFSYATYNIQSIRFINFYSWFLVALVIGLSLFGYESNNFRLHRILQLEKNMFQHDALHDALTGLPNRAHFLVKMQNAKEYQKITERNFAVAIIDIDRFKPINDVYGHAAGDYVLKILANRIRNSIRASDFTARLGGDEFAIVFSVIKNCDCLLEIGKKIVASIEQSIDYEGKQLHVSASIGITVSTTDAESSDSLIKRSDNAMYEAKKSGTRVSFG